MTPQRSANVRLSIPTVDSMCPMLFTVMAYPCLLPCGLKTRCTFFQTSWRRIGLCLLCSLCQEEVLQPVYPVLLDSGQTGQAAGASVSVCGPGPVYWSTAADHFFCDIFPTMRSSSIVSLPELCVRKLTLGN